MSENFLILPRRDPVFTRDELERALTRMKRIEFPPVKRAVRDRVAYLKPSAKRRRKIARARVGRLRAARRQNHYPWNEEMN